jgi:hypothetical protein
VPSVLGAEIAPDLREASDAQGPADLLRGHAVGKYVYDEVVRSGELNVIDEFFHELRRYG